MAIESTFSCPGVGAELHSVHCTAQCQPWTAVVSSWLLILFYSCCLGVAIYFGVKFGTISCTPLNAKLAVHIETCPRQITLFILGEGLFLTKLMQFLAKVSAKGWVKDCRL